MQCLSSQWEHYLNSKNRVKKTLDTSLRPLQNLFEVRSSGGTTCPACLTWPFDPWRVREPDSHLLRVIPLNCRGASLRNYSIIHAYSHIMFLSRIAQACRLELIMIQWKKLSRVLLLVMLFSSYRWASQSTQQLHVPLIFCNYPAACIETRMCTISKNFDLAWFVCTVVYRTESHF